MSDKYNRTRTNLWFKVGGVAAAIVLGGYLVTSRMESSTVAKMRLAQQHISQNFDLTQSDGANSLEHLNYAPDEWWSQCDPDPDKQWSSLQKFIGARGGWTKCRQSEFPAVAPNEAWLNPHSTYRGMQASADIKKGDTTCFAPADLIFSLARVKKGSEVDKVIYSFPEALEVNNFERQQFFLLYEMSNPKSEWRPYLCQMPRHVPLPLFWKDAEVDRVETEGDDKDCYIVRFSNDERTIIPHTLLHVTGEILAESTLDLKPGRRVTAGVLGEDTPYQGWIVNSTKCPNSLRGLSDVVKKRRTRLLTRFNKLRPWLKLRYPGFLDGVLTVSSWAWAYAVIVSRQWSLNDLPAMIPGCDMFNHKYGARVINQTVEGLHTKGVARLHADRDYAAGEEVFISYSDVSCSRKWLHYYGFIPNSNEAVPCKLKT